MKRVLALSAAAMLAVAACGSDDPVSDVVEDVVEEAVEEAEEVVTTDPPPEPEPEPEPAPEEEAPEEEAPAEEVPEEEAPSSDLETLRVAYFQEWPTPNLLGFDDKSFDEAVGVDIEWVPFGGGGEMSEAMESGDIDISYSQGLTPFANTVNNGADIKVVGIAVAYAEADNCVAQGDLGVTRDNAAEVLNGATVMTPSGNVTNFKMLSMMDFLGVDISSLNILPTDGGATTLAAFESGDIDVGCSFGGSLVSMLDAGGNLIMTGAEQVADIGINTYDIVSIPTSFGEEHPEVVVSFLQATQEFNDTWAADPDGTNGTIAAASGMEDVGNFLAGPTWFSFPTLEEQLGADWLGGTVAQNMTEQIQTFVDLGQIDSTIGDFSGSIDTSFLEAAVGDAAPEATGGIETDLETLRVAYFQEWPTPNLLGFDDKSFDEAVGVDIEWVPFGGGGEMSEAMESGDIDISYSQGLTPFANTVNNGADIKVVGIAVAYAEADNCVAQGDLGVTRDNAAEVLNGATVMTPSGNVTNFKMLSMMDFLGVDISSLNILPTDGGATTLAAFESGDIDVGCSFGGSLVSMLDAGGNLIMTGAEQVADIGINTYDIVSIPTSFGEEHPEVVVSFLQATQEFNDTWAADPDGTNGTIAAASGMEDVGNFLAGPTWFSFPTLEEQLGADWLGGTVAQNMTEQIQTFVDLGQIDSTIGDFSGSIDTSFLEAAVG